MKEEEKEETEEAEEEGMVESDRETAADKDVNTTVVLSPRCVGHHNLGMAQRVCENMKDILLLCCFVFVVVVVCFCCGLD